MEITREERQALTQAMTDADLLELYVDCRKNPFWKLTAEERDDTRMIREEVLARMAGRMAVA